MFDAQPLKIKTVIVNSSSQMHVTRAYFSKMIAMRVRRFHEANIVVITYKPGQHCCAALRRSTNNRNVGTCCAKSLTGFKLYTTSANKCQRCCVSVQMDANCWDQQCYVLLANSVGTAPTTCNSCFISTVTDALKYKRCLGEYHR